MQHLDRAADFVVAADDGIELAVACTLGQIHRVFFKRLALTFGLLVRDPFAAAYGKDGGFQRLFVGTVFLECATRVTFVGEHGDQE